MFQKTMTPRSSHPGPSPGGTRRGLRVPVLVTAAALGLAVATGGGGAAADPSLPATTADSEPGVVYREADGSGLRELATPPGIEAGDFADRLEDRPDIAWAEPNPVATVSSWLPDDLLRRKRVSGTWTARAPQWNFLPCGALCGEPAGDAVPGSSRGGIDVVGAWRNLREIGRQGASGVRVAIIDSGVAYRDAGILYRRNPDLWPSSFLPGIDFVDDDRKPLDRNGHGTHITSTVAQATDNGKGLTGIAYRAKIIPVRVMDRRGQGTAFDISRGIRWAADAGAKVMLMSFNFDCGTSSTPVEEALSYARAKGVIMVGSAGNVDSQACPSLPATAPEVLAVGGTTEAGCVASYSFRSPQVEITAPGGGNPAPGCPFSSADRAVLQYSMFRNNPTAFGVQRYWNGTSMAAAHVAGVAAMVVASAAGQPDRTPEAVIGRLLATARMPAHGVGGSDIGFGAGIVDAGAATAPAAP